MTMDLHAGQIQGFFDIPTDNLFAVPLLARDIKEHLETDRVMVVSPAWAAWFAPARSPSASTRRSPSSTSAARSRASPR